MEIKCPRCGQLERPPEEAMGRFARCNACQLEFRIDEKVVVAKAPVPRESAGTPRSSTKSARAESDNLANALLAFGFVVTTVGAAAACGMHPGFWFLSGAGAVAVVVAVCMFAQETVEEERREQQDKLAEREHNKKIVCPHCHERGFVSSRLVQRKKGISGGKATAAVITAGISVLFTGLSRMEEETEAHCSNCGSRWYF